MNLRHIAVPNLVRGAIVLASLLAAAPAGAGLVVIPPPPNARIVNFDNVQNAPTSFPSTIAASTFFISAGVEFKGVGTNGGAVLAENGGFGIDGFSGPNVLAFNVAGTLNGGGTPQLPETMLFRRSASYVQFNVGDTSGITITAEAFDAQNNSLDIDSVTPTNSMQTIALEARHIAKVVITGGGLSTIIDDVAFVIDTTVVNFDEVSAPSTFASAKALRREYLGTGFESTSSQPNDGPAILDQTSGFLVNGFSPPNYLAVNNGSFLSDGGRPQFPIYLQFFPPVKYVRFLVASTDGGTVTAKGSFYNGPTIDEESVTAEATMKPIELSSDEAMTFVEINSTEDTLVLDDLEFLEDGTKIDFDDNPNPPILFDEATAIRNRYETLGVTFTAPGKDGLALLGNNTFGVTGLSGTGFLAFDSTQGLADGGTPKLPTTIHFDKPMKRVDMFVGSNNNTRISINGFDAADQPTGDSYWDTLPGMMVLTMYIEGTTRIEVTSTGNPGVIDNLTFTPMDPCPFDLCYQGGDLNYHCSECATKICADDFSCCSDAWDKSCALAAESLCGLTCGPLCGDANDDRKISATDALAALKTSVGTGSCPAFRCDFNGVGGVKSGDALLILKTSVGQATDPQCPPEPA